MRIGQNSIYGRCLMKAKVEAEGFRLAFLTWPSYDSETFVTRQMYFSEYIVVNSLQSIYHVEQL